MKLYHRRPWPTGFDWHLLALRAVELVTNAGVECPGDDGRTLRLRVCVRRDPVASRSPVPDYERPRLGGGVFGDGELRPWAEGSPVRLCKLVVVVADIFSIVRNDRMMEEIVSRLGIKPEVKAVSWRRATA